LINFLLSVNLLVLFKSIFKLSKNWAIDKYLTKSIVTLDWFWLIEYVKYSINSFKFKVASLFKFNFSSESLLDNFICLSIASKELFNLDINSFFSLFLLAYYKRKL